MSLSYRRRWEQASQPASSSLSRSSSIGPGVLRSCTASALQYVIQYSSIRYPLIRYRRYSPFPSESPVPTPPPFRGAHRALGPPNVNPQPEPPNPPIGPSNPPNARSSNPRTHATIFRARALGLPAIMYLEFMMRSISHIVYRIPHIAYPASLFLFPGVPRIHRVCVRTGGQMFQAITPITRREFNSNIAQVRSPDIEYRISNIEAPGVPASASTSTSRPCANPQAPTLRPPTPDPPRVFAGSTLPHSPFADHVDFVSPFSPLSFPAPIQKASCSGSLAKNSNRGSTYVTVNREATEHAWAVDALSENEHARVPARLRGDIKTSSHINSRGSSRVQHAPHTHHPPIQSSRFPHSLTTAISSAVGPLGFVSDSWVDSPSWLVQVVLFVARMHGLKETKKAARRARRPSTSIPLARDSIESGKGRYTDLERYTPTIRNTSLFTLLVLSVLSARYLPLRANPSPTPSLFTE
ncbi:hypothetical protein BDN71DRAFT_1512206 [Pleurotus eryngii]|uniref:Uncharacterized protein n=1 Tax=Pleurotus eryngii TaxID=5323 RepID=A0A9P6D378_PLEER|nr:hypothetical protein BDN71DRAFT_1512206 [Pleurotus eryngii]